jgi:hypothetical protein
LDRSSAGGIASVVREHFRNRSIADIDPQFAFMTVV